MTKLLHERLREVTNHSEWDEALGIDLNKLTSENANSIADEIERDYIPRKANKETGTCNNCIYWHRSGDFDIVQCGVCAKYQKQTYSIEKCYQWEEMPALAKMMVTAGLEKCINYHAGLRADKKLKEKIHRIFEI